VEEQGFECGVQRIRLGTGYISDQNDEDCSPRGTGDEVGSGAPIDPDYGPAVTTYSLCRQDLS
jgi:hypothetical protein